MLNSAEFSLVSPDLKSPQCSREPLPTRRQHCALFVAFMWRPWGVDLVLRRVRSPPGVTDRAARSTRIFDGLWLHAGSRASLRCRRPHDLVPTVDRANRRTLLAALSPIHSRALLDRPPLCSTFRRNPVVPNRVPVRADATRLDVQFEPVSSPCGLTGFQIRPYPVQVDKKCCASVFKIDLREACGLCVARTQHAGEQEQNTGEKE
jgi:hypothetical protein